MQIAKTVWKVMGPVCVLTAAVAVIQGCGDSDEEHPPTPAPAATNTQAPAATTPTFTQLQQNIFIPRCNVCHNPNNASAGLVFSTYEGFVSLVTPGDAANSELVQRLIGPDPNRMGDLTPAELAQLSAWINAGAQNN
jgi:hypothetical protein